MTFYWPGGGLSQVTADTLYEPINANIQTHIAGPHAPSNSQKNSDITKAEIEAKLTGEIASHTHAGGSQAFPVGAVFIAVVATNPGTLLGYGTWAAFAAGRVLVGLDAGDADFDTAEETSGAKTVAGAGNNSAPTFTGTPFSGVINHTHTVDVTDPGHTHVQGVNSAATGGLVGATPDTSTNTRVNSGYSTSSATTGVTAATQNPAGGVASITPAGTVSAPTFTGSATSVVQPSIAVYMWKRTA